MAPELLGERELWHVQVLQLMEDLKAAQELAEQINIEEKMFGWAATKYGGLAKLITSLEPYYNLWMTTFEFYDKSTACMNQPFKSIDAEQMEELVNDMCAPSMNWLTRILADGTA